MARRGRFITLEGPEGAGKSTQAEMLGAALRARGIDVVQTREPGGTVLAEKLRDLLKHFRSEGEAVTPVAELLLMNAARAQHVQYKILPALEAGKWVVCDRFSDSTLAYQGYARGMDRELIAQVSRAAVGACPIDRTLLFDLPVAAGFARTRTREATAGNFDRFEREDGNFHERVRAGFLALAQAEPARFRVIAADRTPDEVHASVMEALDDLL